MKRVMIIGGAGAGKSTLAQLLGEITGLPVVHKADRPERFDWAFLKWVVGYANDGRHKALSLIESAPKHVRVLRFQKPVEVKTFVEHVG